MPTADPWTPATLAHQMRALGVAAVGPTGLITSLPLAWRTARSGWSRNSRSKPSMDAIIARL